MQYLTNDDLTYLSAQNQDKMNMVVYGMTALMDETNDRVQQLESQTWFQRMSNTLTGKNKMTVNEIANNRDKINVYLSEAISCLYDQNKINENMILGLGNRLNELYAQQIEIKQMIGAFVTKLNQKIISIDNFHMLTEEINQGVYSADTPIVSICKIASQLDARTIHDSRKMNILLRAMEQQGLISDEEVLFVDFLQELLKVSEADSGVIAMMFENAKEDYITQISLETLCQYFLLPDKVRKMKNRKSIAESVLLSNQIDLEYSLSPKEYYEGMFLCLSNAIPDNSTATVGEIVQCEELTQKGIAALEKKDFEEAVKCFTIAAQKGYADAQNRLALRYTRGEGVPKNEKKAFELYMKAAQQGHMKAQYNVGVCYSDGDGVEEQKEMAFEWFLKSAEQGYDIAQIHLAECYYYGEGTEEDEEEAKKLLELVAKQGSKKATELLEEWFGEDEEDDASLEDLEQTVNKLKETWEDEGKAPCISFTDDTGFLGDTEIENETHIGVGFNKKNQVRVLVHFKNMNNLGKIHFSIIENEVSGASTSQALKSYGDKPQYKVEWGDWKNQNACELIVNKIVYPVYTFGSLKIKVWADSNPDCIGIINA